MKPHEQKADWQSVGIIFSVGFFGLVAQTLLFRLFLTVFEGNELGIACFFGSWLTWVAVGAFCARSRLPVVQVLTERFEFLPLLYLPAFVLQWWLISSAREITGVQRYEMFPLFTMLPVTFLTNAPVSLCTGMLFTLGCRWLGTRSGTPVAKVYVWECAGSFAGGTAVTYLLSRGLTAETLVLGAALLVTLAPAAYLLGRKRSYMAAAIPVLAIAAALFTGTAGRWERYNNLLTWRRLLPPETLQGSFTTPEAKYLYGEHSGQFSVVSWETVTDTIPDTEHASEVVAIHLAQRPQARRFLVAGRGTFSICRRLLALPQVDAVTWLDPDPAYPPQLRSVLPRRFTSGLERLETPAGDIRRWLVQSRAKYDMIILNFPDATTLALNHYFTREFFLQVKAHLNPSGAVGVRFAAGANYMSEERVNTGATVFHTLRAVFAYSVIKPGEESWLIASDSPGLTTAPAELRDRFAAIEGADRLYPPAGLMSLYSPQRSEYQSNSYEKAGDGAAKGLLLNTERAPKALLHELLFAARESGGAAWLGKFIRTFALHGFFVAPVGLLLFSLLRTLFHLNHRGARDAAPDGSPSLFDSYTLVFTTGAAGMGGIMVLMYLYQSAFGSIFLHVGLLSAIYMLGLAAGSAASARLLAGSTRRSAWLPVCAILLQVILYGGMTLLGAKVGQAVFAAAFALSGLLGGVYVPVAARRLKAAGLPHDTAGAGIEAADHIGGAVGGLVTGLLLIPVFGTTYGLALLTLLLLTNLIALRPLAGSTGVGSAPQHDRRLAGHSGYYILFGLVAFVLAAGLLLRREGTEEAQQAFLAFSRAAAGQGGSLEQRHALAHGKALQYFVLESNLPGEKASVQGYVFMTDSLAPDIPGYGGPLALAAWVAADGTLRNVAILPSRETPAYLDYLHSWLGRLSGKNLFGPDPLKDVDAVTGATLTSAAVLQILRKSGPAFAGEVLGRDLVPSVPVPHPRQLHRESLWLVAVTAAALVLRRKPSRLPRRGFLLLIVVGSGFLLNAQYSLAHVFSLLGLNPPPVGLNTAFLLVVGVPLIVALFGNIYCGYLCPFGALQELVGDLRPACLRTDPDKSAWGRARVVKYVLLAVLTLLFGTTFRHVLASGDPLITVFAEGRSLVVLCFAMLLLGLAFFYPRFWCRCLCPAGAFLALLNGVRLFKRFAPSVVPQSCQFGVRDRRELDCLCCDRCRRPGPREEEAPAGTASGAASRQVNTWLLAAAIALACLVTIRSVSMWSGEHSARRTGGMVSRGIGARPVDLKRLQSLIEQNRLSSREARFYQPAPREPGSP